MSSLVINGDTSGSITLAAPAVAGSNTITLPTVGGTMRTTTTPGTLLQVVSTIWNPTAVSTTSTSYVDTGLSLGITLLSSSSKVLMLYNGGHAYVNSGFPNGMIETICRQSSTTYNSANDLSGGASFGMTQIYNAANINTSPHSINYLDATPGSTTPTYRVFFKSRNAGNVQWQEGSSQLSFTLMEIAA